MDTSFKTISAIVTGAARGIGLATAKLLYERGGTVALVDVDADSGTAAMANFPPDSNRAFFLQADLSRPAEAERVVHEAAKKLGSINGLVNNAGIQRYGNVEETSLDLWQEVLAVNLTSAFSTSRAVIPYLRRSGWGSIVNIGSVQSFVSQRGATAYVTSKHALLGLTRALAVDYAIEKIRVTCVCPGTVDTPMFRESAALDPNPTKIVEACEMMHPAGRLARPEEIAKTILFLLSDASSFVTGTAITVDGGLLAVLGGSPKE